MRQASGDGKMKSRKNLENRSPLEGQCLGEPLTPYVRRKLASLALETERYTDLADKLREPCAMLSSYETRSEDIGPAAEMLNRTTQRLRSLCDALAHQMVLFALQYEKENTRTELSPR